MDAREDPTAPEKPNAARIYDYALGGAHNFEVDRVAAHRIIAAYPGIVAVGHANRHFLRHAVNHCLDAGISQFLDLGSGIPTVGNVHEVALARDPTAAVAYVDSDPVAVAHSRNVMAGLDTVSITHADLTDPDTVLAADAVQGTIDFERPLAILALASLHFVPDTTRLRDVIRRYRHAQARGSVMVISHVSEDYYPEHPEVADSIREVNALYQDTATPTVTRSRDELAILLDRCALEPPGLVDIHQWAIPPTARPLGVYAAITRPSDQAAGNAITSAAPPTGT